MGVLEVPVTQVHADRYVIRHLVEAFGESGRHRVDRGCLAREAPAEQADLDRDVPLHGDLIVGHPLQRQVQVGEQGGGVGGREPLRVVRHPDRAQPAADYTALIGGLHATPALITHEGAQSGVQVALSPFGCRALFGVTPGELSSIDVPADDVLGPLAGRARQCLLDAATWPQRFGALDALLARQVREPPVAPELVHAWRLIRSSRGTVAISTVATEIGWSARYLSRRFVTDIGLPPKLVARVVRFDHARRLAASTGGTLADVAAATGYADQAHLARDFRDLAGCSPSAWLAAERPNRFRNVQAEVEPVLPGWSLDIEEETHE